jgi:hypothetical protein
MAYCHWHPTRFKRYINSVASSTGTSRILTDAGEAFIKPLGNKEGPHVLACEWVATRLADWFGLDTFDHSILAVEAIDEIPLAGSRHAAEGRAFVARLEAGSVWSGLPDQLVGLENREQLGRLVVFDTWTLNCDRHPPDTQVRRPNLDNVFISADRGGGHWRVVAMDHTHCFTCGRELGPDLANIDRIKDPRVYGLFPGFVPFVSRSAVRAATETLMTLRREMVQPIVEAIPIEWQVAPEARAALIDLIVDRAAFVAETVEESLVATCWPSNPDQPEE